MKRYQYIKPNITILATKTESHLTTLSPPHTEDKTNGGETGPSDGEIGGESDLAKKFDAWSTWDDDFE